MKLRIIKIIPELSKYLSLPNERHHDFIIQKKTFWGWKEITNTESPFLTKRIGFNTYEEAEKYIFQNYYKNGFITQIGNTYTQTDNIYAFFI